MGSARRVVATVIAAGGARALLGGVSRLSTTVLTRTNHRGESVTLAEGPAAALAATLAAAALCPGAGANSGRVAAAAAVAGLGAAAVGGYDDIVGARPDQRKDKGFAGHLRALREGRVSAGAVKVLGVGGSGLVAGVLLLDPGPRRPIAGAALDIALSGAVVAGAANVVNLLDLRPGRALKATLAAAVPLLGRSDAAGTVAAAVTGAALASLPEDLGERTMLGDAGANALGALLGVAAVARLGRPGRTLVAAGLIGLMAASERVSFTAVIARTPALNAIDLWGRRPPASAPPPAAGATAVNPTVGEPGSGAVAR